MKIYLHQLWILTMLNTIIFSVVEISDGPNKTRAHEIKNWWMCVSGFHIVVGTFTYIKKQLEHYNSVHKPTIAL